MSQFKPNYSSFWYEIFLEKISERCMSEQEGLFLLGCEIEDIEDMRKGLPMSSSFAERLEAVTGIDSKFWTRKHNDWLESL